MESLLGFIILIVIVLLVAAFGMWAAQGVGSRLGRKGPANPVNRPAAPLSGDSLVTHHPSPDGRFEVITAANEARSGHWVESPTLREVATAADWFSLDGRWSADQITWAPDSASVTIKLRKYPGDVPGLTLVATPGRADATFITRAGTESAPLDQVELWLEQYIRRFGVRTP